LFGPLLPIRAPLVPPLTQKEKEWKVAQIANKEKLPTYLLCEAQALQREESILEKPMWICEAGWKDGEDIPKAVGHYLICGPKRDLSD
jgi:hypothetical protein